MLIAVISTFNQQLTKRPARPSLDLSHDNKDHGNMILAGSN